MSIYDICNRLNRGQDQNEIGGAHLHHVGSAMHACHFVEKVYIALAVVHFNKNQYNKIKIKHDLGNRFNGGQDQNNIYIN